MQPLAGFGWIWESSFFDVRITDDPLTLEDLANNIETNMMSKWYVFSREHTSVLNFDNLEGWPYVVQTSLVMLGGGGELHFLPATVVKGKHTPEY